MARKSLRPYLNQIRTWTRQGRTDAWVAHQLEVTVQEIEQFKRQNGLLDNEQEESAWPDDEVDLRAADEALIARELEEAELAARREAEAVTTTTQQAPDNETEENGADRKQSAADESPAQGRQRGKKQGEAVLRVEGTFDHGEEGYGLWLDPAIKDHPVYAEHWAGHRPVEVFLEADQIVIRRLGEQEGD